jgi:hypothetical protein
MVSWIVALHAWIPMKESKVLFFELGGGIIATGEAYSYVW